MLEMLQVIVVVMKQMSQDENEEDIDFDMGGEDCHESRDVNTWEKMGLFPDGHDSERY